MANGILGLGLLSATAATAESKGKVHLAYVEWASTVASTNVMKAVLEQAGFDVNTTSLTGATMTAALGNAIKNNENIVVTSWTPHWMFARWDLKYLDDPKGIYGNKEEIHTIVRQGLQKDLPEVYAILKNVNWTPKDMSEVMLMIEPSNTAPDNSAKKWVAEHPELVKKWTAINDSP